MQVITEKTTPGYVPDAYETAPITIDGYRYTNIVVGEETGTYAKDENIKVYYYYDPVGKVIVKYLEEGTNKVLADEEVLVDPIGSVYTTYDYYKENIDNYNWVRTEGNERGRYTTDDQEVIYYYQIPAVTGNLVVNYIDQDNNLLDSWSNTEEVGTEYTTEEKSFDGYTPKYVIGATSGTYSAGTTTVTYVYAKNQATPTGEVVVKYIENTGRKLVDEDIVISGEYGTSYTTEQKSFDGYNFVAVYGPTQGSIDQPKTTVIYMYEKVKSDETGTGSCNNNCCNCCSSCNNSCNNGGEGESTQPVINIDITINNDNSTEVNNENNNQDENNNNIENNPVNNVDVNVETGDTNVSTGDTNVNVSTGDTNVTTGDNNIENNTNVETGDNNNTTNIENNPTIETGDVTNNNTAEGGNSSNTNTNTDGDVIVNTGDVTQETGDNNNTNNNNVEGGDNTNTNNNNNNNDNNTCTDCNNPSEEPGDEPSNPGQDSTPTGAVVAYYRSLDGDILAENYYDEKDVDSIYVTPEKPIEGYEFVRTEGAQPTGTITDGLTKVYYYYKKKESTPQPGPDNPPVTNNGEVVAHYVDIYGNMIGVNKYYEGKVGDPYETQIRNFRGYRLVQIVGARTGEFTNGKTEVTYIYEKNPTGSTTGEDIIITPTREIIKYLPNETGFTTGSSKYSSVAIPNTGVSEKSIPYSIILLISSIFSIIMLKRIA